MLRALATASTLTLCASVGGCASDALSTAGAIYDVADLTTNPTLLVATTRKPVNGARAKPWYGPERAASLSLARAKLTPPGDGRFSLNAIGLDDWRLDAVEPVSQIGDLYAEPGIHDVLIYVHGFNQTFESAALDAARLSGGIRFRGETMVFSWPSKANLFDYGYDRESAMWSRDALDQVLTGLMASPNIGRIHVVAHSVGTMLAMEALRQVYARQPAAASSASAPWSSHRLTSTSTSSPPRSSTSARLRGRSRWSPRPTTGRWPSRASSPAASPASAPPKRPSWFGLGCT